MLPFITVLPLSQSIRHESVEGERIKVTGQTQEVVDSTQQTTSCKHKLFNLFQRKFFRGTYELNVNIIAEISSYCNRHFKNLIPYMQCLVEKLQHQIVDLTVACQKEID